MAVAYVAAGKVEGVWSSGTTMTLSSVGGSGGNLVVVFVTTRTNGQVVTGVTYGGNAMTQIGSTVTVGGGAADAYYYLTSSDGNVVVTWDTAPNNAQATALVFSGAHATTPIGTSVSSANNAASTSTGAATSETDGMCADVLFVRGSDASVGTISPDAEQTQRSAQTQTDSIKHRTSTEPGAASVTMSWSWAGANNYGHIVVPIAPAAAAGNESSPSVGTVVFVGGQPTTSVSNDRPITPYNSFKETIGDGTIDLDTHTLKVCVVTSGYTPSASHTQLSDVSTWRVSGTTDAALASVTWAQTLGVATLDADDLFIPFPAGGTPKYAILYDDTASGDPLIAYITLADSLTISAGSSLKLVWNAAGIFYVN